MLHAPVNPNLNKTFYYKGKLIRNKSNVRSNDKALLTYYSWRKVKMNSTCIMIHKTVHLVFQPTGITLMVENPPSSYKKYFFMLKV